MKCPRQFTKFSTKGDTGELGPDCPECMNYFFGECIAGKPSFIYRLPSATLGIFAVQLTQTFTRETTVHVYAKSRSEAEDAVDNDLEKTNGLLPEKLSGGLSGADGDIDSNIYVAEQIKKAELVAYDGAIFDIKDFKDYVKERGFEENEEVPLLAEL